ncbi:MAG: ATP-binding protein [Leptolyngbyaceae cyanobacterium RU_5_1]|nr:ATP-binding protein [Leptolyngbyaceae cyanobacterium RU_5_1]
MPILDLQKDASESSRTPLSLESKLEDLILYNYQIETCQLSIDIAKIFDDNPLLPGVVLTENNRFFGMLSRRRYLEFITRPYGPELFLKRPLRIFYNLACIEVLVLSGKTKIVVAMQQSLQRSPELFYEPIVVQLDSETHHLLDVHHLLLSHSRIHELTTTLLNEQTQAKLIQTEKMASLGQMVAGVAHEINNPVNFISGNIEYLASYCQNLTQILSVYETEFPQSSAKIEQIKEEADVDFIVSDLPQMITSMKVGVERLKKIVGALRNFSHMDEVTKRPIDIHECLDNTLLILNNRLKNTIAVVKNYGELPPVSCYSGQISQVFTNLISNAIDALTERSNSPLNPDWNPQIEITTSVVTNEEGMGDCLQSAAIYIADNGPGIPLEIQTRIFETFFTTKPVGKGTGLGLAISRQIVVEKHAGQLDFQSESNLGTTFEIRLPLS